MAFHLEIAFPYPVEELKKQFSKGEVGPVRLGSIEPFPPDSWRAEWAYGRIIFESLSPDVQIMYDEDFHLAGLFQSCLWITTEPYYEGQLEAYALTAYLLRTQPGDLALIFHGESVMVQRVNGEIKLRVESMNKEILSIFDGLDYVPLGPS